MGCGASAASSPPSSPPSAYPPPSSRADLARLCERSIELNDGRLLVRGKRPVQSMSPPELT